MAPKTSRWKSDIADHARFIPPRKALPDWYIDGLLETTWAPVLKGQEELAIGLGLFDAPICKTTGIGA